MPLYIYEKDGQPWCLIEWLFLYPLTIKGENELLFSDTFGMYFGENLVFKRDAQGNVTGVTAGGIWFPRRSFGVEEGKVFRIKPLKPVDELLKDALAAQPPVEKGEFQKPQLMEIPTQDTGIKVDLKYATADNFLGTPLYPKIAKAYLQKPAVVALTKVQAELKEKGYGLLVYDAYRPWRVTKMFWDAVPEKYHGFVADPKKGSRHNRGCAVDVTLYDLKTGQPVEMVSTYDEFTDRAFPMYVGGTSLQRYHRDLLRRAMERQGFQVYEGEWWHFDYQDWKQYPIGNQSFEELAK
jgi:serine beta-lactamase-like protein LACTB